MTSVGTRHADLSLSVFDRLIGRSPTCRYNYLLVKYECGSELGAGVSRVWVKTFRAYMVNISNSLPKYVVYIDIETCKLSTR